MERARDRAEALSSRLAPALARLITEAARETAKGNARLTELAARLEAAPAQRLAALTQRLDALDRTRKTLGPAETLRRGYAVLRGGGAVVTDRAAAEKASSIELEFHDGKVTLGAKAAPRKTSAKPPEQGSLF